MSRAGVVQTELYHAKMFWSSSGHHYEMDSLTERLNVALDIFLSQTAANRDVRHTQSPFAR